MLGVRVPFENQFKLLLVAAVVLIAILAITLQWSFIKLALFAGVTVCGISLWAVPAHKTIYLYLGYMFFEGMIKILSNYNPILHFAGDGLLMFVLIRLIGERVKPHNQQPELPKLIIATLALYWVWVLIQFLNPSGLGIVASLAAMRMYAVPVTAFFVTAYLLTARQLRYVPHLIVGFGILSGAFAIIDWNLGESFLSSLSPRYSRIAGLRFSGTQYRPFGFTNGPGAPSIWMFLCAPAALILFHSLRYKTKTLKSRLWDHFYLLVIAFAPIAVMTLMVCQVRTMIVRVAAVVVFGIASFGRRGIQTLVAASLFFGALSFSVDVGKPEGVDSVGTGADNKFEVVLARLFTLADRQTFTESREALWPRLMSRGEITMQGIGLSRTGAASAYFANRIKQDPLFDSDWSFTDNAYLAIFTELGLGGLIAYLILHINVVIQLLRRNTFASRVVAVMGCVLIVAGYASEEILYAPVAPFYWMYCGFALKYDPKEAYKEESGEAVDDVHADAAGGAAA